MNFIICFPAGFGQFLLFLYVFLSFWGRKAPQNTHQAKSTLLDNRDTSEMDHVSYSANEQTFYLACWQFLHWLWFLQAFSQLEKKAHKTHVRPYVAICTTKTAGRLIIFYALPMTDFVFCFLTVFEQLLWFL